MSIFWDIRDSWKHWRNNSAQIHTHCKNISLEMYGWHVDRMTCPKLPPGSVSNWSIQACQSPRSSQRQSGGRSAGMLWCAVQPSEAWVWAAALLSSTYRKNPSSRHAVMVARHWLGAAMKINLTISADIGRKRWRSPLILFKAQNVSLSKSTQFPPCAYTVIYPHGLSFVNINNYQSTTTHPLLSHLNVSTLLLSRCCTLT